MSKPSVDLRLLDARSIERNIKQCVISRKDVENYLDSLPDVADKAITLGAIEDQRRADTEPAGGEPGDNESS